MVVSHKFNVHFKDKKCTCVKYDHTIKNAASKSEFVLWWIHNPKTHT